MTVLFITLLLLGACAEKPASSVPSTQTQPNEPEPDKISHMDTQKVSFPPISQEYIDNMDQLERENPDALVARYDKGLNLKLLKNGELRWYRFQQYPEFADFVEGVNISLYYDEMSKNVYIGRWGEEISNILYIIDPDHQEHYPSGKEKDPYDEKALYVGSLDPLQRIYYHPEFKKLYVMRLSLTNPQSYVSRETRQENGKTHIIDVTNKLTSPIYPVTKLYDEYPVVYFTNDQDLFYIGLSVDGDFTIHLVNLWKPKNISNLNEHKPEPDEMSHTDIPNLALASVSQEYIDNIEQLERENPNALIARYDKGLNLKLLRSGEIRWYRFRLNPDYDVAEGVNGSLYYDEMSNNFYTGRWAEEISNILYIIDPDHQEHYPSGKEKDPDDEKALYAGSLDPLQRIYYHPEFKKLYLIRLSLTNPQSYVSREEREENGKIDSINVTNKLTSPVYPVTKLHYGYPRLYFTNDQGFFYTYLLNGNFTIHPVEEDG